MFSRFNNPSQLTAPRLVLSTHTILSAGFSFLDASNNAFVEAIDMEYVSDFLWSYQAWCVRHSIKSWTMLIINLAGWVLGRTNGLPCDFWRFTGAWSSITMGQNYIRTTSGAWNGSMATIVWNHPRFVTASVPHIYMNCVRLVNNPWTQNCCCVKNMLPI